MIPNLPNYKVIKVASKKPLKVHIKTTYTNPEWSIFKYFSNDNDVQKYPIVSRIDENCEAYEKGLRVGDKINLERSLKVNSRISGHFVQGHVDCIGTCSFINKKDGDVFFIIQYPKKFQNLIFKKGSICINGVSLTISKIKDSDMSFEVWIIPHTLKETTFQFMKKNDKVNLEFDMISKQIDRTVSLLKS